MPLDSRQVERRGQKAGNNVRRYYSMKTISRKALVILAAVVVALVIIGIREVDNYIDELAWERDADFVYPMTNQHIEWTGAGYQ